MATDLVKRRTHKLRSSLQVLRCGLRREEGLQMATIYVVPVFNVAGNFVRNEAGVTVYEGGKVEKFEEMDIDHVNFGDLEKLLQTLGFMTYKRMFWLNAKCF
ncbi:hypothetical protein PIB30_091662 [Stylosanthes scabra]|uniref:PB1-like domain-containing protein n=1 Tax=Stylosanthes scabra TaxID=79078 RepID=A0ABU6UVA9_9FABA|nr:hypothetical protein [Stylosanthes scabra]